MKDMNLYWMSESQWLVIGQLLFGPTRESLSPRPADLSNREDRCKPSSNTSLENNPDISAHLVDDNRICCYVFQEPDKCLMLNSSYVKLE